jgi:transcriptional regulator with XRE-family HTH domain
MQTPQEVARKISSVVKQRRKSLGISQEQLALIVGIDRTYASQIERAIANPSLTVLCNIATALNLSLSQLVGEMAINQDAE